MYLVFYLLYSFMAVAFEHYTLHVTNESIQINGKNKIMMKTYKNRMERVWCCFNIIGICRIRFLEFFISLWFTLKDTSVIHNYGWRMVSYTERISRLMFLAKTRVSVNDKKSGNQTYVMYLRFFRQEFFFQIHTIVYLHRCRLGVRASVADWCFCNDTAPYTIRYLVAKIVACR